jgi:hypothetical protein
MTRFAMFHSIPNNKQQQTIPTKTDSNDQRPTTTRGNRRWNGEQLYAAADSTRNNQIPHATS